MHDEELKLQLTTGPASEPVTLNEAKQHLNYVGTRDDDYITSLIKVARENHEEFTGRALFTQTWSLDLDRFPFNVIRIPRPPLASITHVKYINTSGTLTTFSASDYVVDTRSEPARVHPAFGSVWPTPRGIENAVQIEFIAGWPTVAAIPEIHKHAIKLLVSNYYELREPVLTGTIATELPLSYKNLAWKQRIFEWA